MKSEHYRVTKIIENGHSGDEFHGIDLKNGFSCKFITSFSMENWGKRPLEGDNVVLYKDNWGEILKVDINSKTVFKV